MAEIFQTEVEENPRLPITNNEALEAELRLQQAVLCRGIIAGVGVVDSIVGAHDVSCSGLIRGSECVARIDKMISEKLC